MIAFLLRDPGNAMLLFHLYGNVPQHWDSKLGRLV